METGLERTWEDRAWEERDQHVWHEQSDAEDEALDYDLRRVKVGVLTW